MLVIFSEMLSVALSTSIDLISHLFVVILGMKDFIVNHMHNADKYVFDRKLRMPDSLMSDAEPFPMPTRQYKEDYNGYMDLMLPHREMWMDHLALTIGRDLQVSTEF